MLSDRWDSYSKLLKSKGILKAAIGIEPMIRVLQTSALPLGYAAENRDEGGGMRDEEKPLSFIPHPSALIIFKAGDEI